jgi:predicted transcriptional regulator
MKTTPITLQMLQMGQLKKGDQIISSINYADPKTGRSVFTEGSEYNVISLFPSAMAPEGFIATCDLGKWYLYFKKGGGGDLFSKVIEKDEEELLADYGTLPNDILRLVLKKTSIRRREIVETISYTMGIDAKGKKNILQALRLLETKGYVGVDEGSLDKYTITRKGLQLLGVDKPSQGED